MRAGENSLVLGQFSISWLTGEVAHWIKGGAAHILASLTGQDV